MADTITFSVGFDIHFREIVYSRLFPSSQMRVTTDEVTFTESVWMGVVTFLYRPDPVLTASDLENLAFDLLAELPIPGVEGCGFDSGIIRQTILQASVDQKSIKAVPDTTHGTYSDDYTLEQLHTVPVDDLEAAVNDIFAQQVAMILGPGPRSSASTSSIFTTTAVHTLKQANSVTRNPAIAPASAIAISLDSSSVEPNHSSSQSRPSVVMNRKATQSSDCSTTSRPCRSPWPDFSPTAASTTARQSSDWMPWHQSLFQSFAVGNRWRRN